jgi:hypothetical protein
MDCARETVAAARCAPLTSASGPQHSTAQPARPALLCLLCASSLLHLRPRALGRMELLRHWQRVGAKLFHLKRVRTVPRGLPQRGRPIAARCPRARHMRKHTGAEVCKSLHAREQKFRSIINRSRAY